MATQGGLKLAFMGAVGLILIDIGLTGKLGSFLGAIIDPSNMQDSAGGSAAATGGGLPVTGTLTPTQIKQYASQAGFSGGSLAIAIAIALAESGGSVAATSPLNSDGTIDRGLWQINSIHSQYDPTQLLTPLYNAQAAYSISNGGTNWYAWTTYNSGSYLAYLAQAKAA